MPGIELSDDSVDSFGARRSRADRPFHDPTEDLEVGE